RAPAAWEKRGLAWAAGGDVDDRQLRRPFRLVRRRQRVLNGTPRGDVRVVTAHRKLWVVGLSHHSAPVELRERLALADGTAGSVARKLLERVPGIDECVLLSTCNRVEMLACGDPQRVDPSAVAKAIGDDRGLRHEDLRAHLYVHEDRAAVRHLF